MVTVCCCCVAGLSETLRMNTAPWSTSLRASAAEMSGRDWSSSISSSILRPSTPPWRLISSAPKITPSVARSEYGFGTPTRSVMTPVLIVSCAKTLPTKNNHRNPRILISPSSVHQTLFVHPSYTKLDRLLQQLGLALVIVCGALDHPHGLVLAGRRSVDDAGVRLGHRVVGGILD